MAPGAPEPAPPAPVRERTATAGGSNLEAEEPDARAPLRWPYRNREQQERALRRAAEAEESESTPESDEESEEEEKNSISQRESDEEAKSESGQSEQSSRAALQPGDPPRQNDIPDHAATTSGLVVTLTKPTGGASRRPAIGSTCRWSRTELAT